MYLYPFILQSHSILRWVALLFLIIAIINSLRGLLKKTPITGNDLKISLWAMVTFHLQVLLGFVLYFISPKVQFTTGMMKSDLLRFYTMEHVLLMLISIVLITLGYSRAKKMLLVGHKQIFVFYFISILLVLIAIPWPFREVFGTNWI